MAKAFVCPEKAVSTREVARVLDQCRYLAPRITALAVAIVVLSATLGQWSWTTTLPASAATAAYPLKVSSNGRYLVDQVGQPFFVNGDAAWSMIAQLSDTDKDAYLANRQSHSVNMVLVSLIEHLYATNAPKDIYKNAPFTGTTFATPNDAYFQHADYAINSAAQKGIVVLLDPLYLGSNCDNEGWCNDVKSTPNSVLQSYGQYVGNRYKSYNNIVWVIGGDMDPTTVASQMTAFVNGLTSVDNRHLITAHNTHDEMAVTPWPGATWLTRVERDADAAIFSDREHV